MLTEEFRVRPVYRMEDYPDQDDPQALGLLREVFQFMFPGDPDARFERPGTGYAMAARNPILANALVRVSKTIVKDLAWTKRADLRELAVQVANLHFKCALSFEAHLVFAERAGLTQLQQAALPVWRSSTLFDDEQRLVIEYTEAMLNNRMTDELFATAVARYGETGAFEFMVVIAWWSFWAMILNSVVRVPQGAGEAAA